MLAFHEGGKVDLENRETYLDIMKYLIQQHVAHVSVRYDTFHELQLLLHRNQMCKRIMQAYTNLFNNSMNIPSLTCVAYERVRECANDDSTVENLNVFLFFCQGMYRNHLWLHGTVLDHLSHNALHSGESCKSLCRRTCVPAITPMYSGAGIMTREIH